MTTLRLLYTPAHAAAPTASPLPRQRLLHRWSYGRGYVVIVLLAPLLVGSLLLMLLHDAYQRGLQAVLLTFQGLIKEIHD